MADTAPISQGPKDTSLQSTKQMLDELDALMERMLSLPVNELEEELTSPPKETSVGPSLAASLTLLGPGSTPNGETSTRSPKSDKNILGPTKKPIETRRAKPKLPHPPLEPPHLKRGPATTAQTPESLTRSTGSSDEVGRIAHPADEVESAAIPGSEPEPLTNEVMPPTIVPQLEPLLADAPELPEHAASSLTFAPIWWLNQAFDHSTVPLGMVGRWLRSQAGRALLGLSGVAMILGAAGWALKDYLGWNW